MSQAPALTDRSALQMHRARAAKSPVSFLHEAAADEVQERLSDVKKTFTKPALIGPSIPCFDTLLKGAVHAHDTPRLALEPQAHDLAVHAFGLHWADDPIGQLVQMRLALEPDGLALAVMFGGETLSELRACLAEAETRLTGGLSPRVLPMADLRDMGGILQRAGLALPVADSVKLTVRYPSLPALARDLRGMGETNALATRHKACPPRRLFEETERIYHNNFGDNGYLNATFELVFLTGWAPHEAQQQPLRPGSAKTPLAQALGVAETSLKES